MWIDTAISAASALFGGFIGGCVVAFRLGRWRQRVEDRLASIEAGMLKSDHALYGVPVLSTRVELILEELRIIKSELRDDRGRYVSHEECNRRHHNAQA